MTKLTMRLTRLAIPLIAGTLAATAVHAQEYTLNMTHHLSPQAIGHRLFLEPWAERIAEASDGRLQIDIFPALQMGGSASDVYSQVRDGVADIGWTLPGYSSGLFPITEVFELPFIAGSATATAPALMEFHDMYLQDEWSEVKVLALHTTAPGGLHTVSTPVRTVDEMEGLRIRAPSAIGLAALEEFGAVPVGMPVPQVYEALQRNVMEGALLPWTIMGPTRLYEVTGYSTDLRILASTFVLFMNKGTFDSLPEDLQQVLEDNSGMELVEQAGVLWDQDEADGRDRAIEAGVEIIEPSEEELAAWHEAAQPVLDSWVADMDARGLPGQEMLDEARALIEKYEDGQQ